MKVFTRHNIQGLNLEYETNPGPAVTWRITTSGTYADLGIESLTEVRNLLDSIIANRETP